MVPMTSTLTGRATGESHLSRMVPVLTRGRFGPTRPQAARAAAALHRIVDRDLELVRCLPADRRSRQADRLTLIVLLSQTYRHYANGWIGRRDLRRRLRCYLDQLTAWSAASGHAAGERGGQPERHGHEREFDGGVSA